MVILKVAWLGLDGLDDIGYQLFSGNNPIGPRITNGVTDSGDGWYEAQVTFPANFNGHIYWNSLAHPEFESREYITPEQNPDLIILTIIAHDAITERNISDAVVRAESGGEVFTSKTDSSGVSQFNLPSGNYVVSIIKNGCVYY